MKVLCANIGSESRKYALFSDGNELWSEHIENQHEQLNPERLKEHVDVIAMRVVAPGVFFQTHRVIDEAYMSELERVSMLDPVHIKPVVAEINFFRGHFPNAPQIAISDSAFHSTIPDYARIYAIPARDTASLGIQKYGYHGISVSYVVATLKEHGLLGDRTIVCHLGGGSSITALKNGKSVDTTMGMTPLGGLPMATRVGDIDPGALVHLSAVKHFTPGQLSEYLSQESGFKGIAGTADMRELLARESSDPAAALAIQLYVYQIQKHIGAYTAVLGGLDTLVFTGTIGLRAEKIREKVVEDLNLEGVRILYFETNEMAEMARLAQTVGKGA